jgi:hypothetical protein
MITQHTLQDNIKNRLYLYIYVFNLNRLLEQNEGNICGRLLVLVIEAENLQQPSTGKNYVLPTFSVTSAPSLCKLLFIFFYFTSHGFSYLFGCLIGFLPISLFFRDITKISIY